MNREIKFRAWQRYHERMLKVTGFQFDQYGTLESVSTFRENQTPESIIYSRFYDDFNLYIDEVPTLVLMQYTGLKDKNGVEIYEGDIIRTYLSDIKGEARWGRIVMKNPFEYSVEEALYINYADELEILGNIYENPELLKENTNEQIQG